MKKVTHSIYFTSCMYIDESLKRGDFMVISIMKTVMEITRNFLFLLKNGGYLSLIAIKIKPVINILYTKITLLEHYYKPRKYAHIIHFRYNYMKYFRDILIYASDDGN